VANKLKTTVDYFPFFVSDGRTFYILEKKFGALGIGYFTQVWRLLSRTPGHVFSMRDDFDRERLLDFVGSKEHPVTEEEMFEFLDILANTGKISTPLWYNKRIIVSEDFLESLAEAYRQRKGERPTYDKIVEEYEKLPDCRYSPGDYESNGIITVLSRDNHGIITETPVQRKENKSKENEIRKDKDTPAAAAEQLEETDNLPIPVESDKAELYTQIKTTFEKQQPGHRFKNYGKEGKAIKELIKEAKARSPDDPDGFIFGMIQMFQELRENDEFYKKHPFTPSALNSAGIFDRVLNEAEQRWKAEQEAQEFTEEIIF
jgi:hypothetical protein